jgi:hypothetical protein
MREVRETITTATTTTTTTTTTTILLKLILEPAGTPKSTLEHLLTLY